LEWFWRGRALRQTEVADPAQRAAALCDQRARIAAEVAQRTLEPSAPWLAGDADHLARALFVESIGWSLRVLDGRTTGGAAAGVPADRAELRELATAQHGQLLATAGSEAALSRVLDSLLDRHSEADAPSEHASATRDLALVATALIDKLPIRRTPAEAVLLQRWARLSVLVLVLAALVLGSLQLLDAHEKRSDLAAGKSWTTSSQYDVGCVSPLQECGSGKSYFFHTQEERNPWIQFDLTKPERVSKVHITNRQDCCGERAVPLLVEVSLDAQSWKVVARRKDEFEEWTAKFTPVNARYVRLRAGRRVMLHFKQVRIFE
jgi:hypothetical protein